MATTPLINSASRRLVELASRGQLSEFTRALDPCVKPDLRSGAASIDSDRLQTALQTVLTVDEAFETANAMREFLSPGFLLVGKDSADRQTVVVPWSTVGLLLETVRSDLARMVATDLGLKRAKSVRAIQQALERQSTLPDFFDQPEVMERFSRALRDRDDPRGGWEGDIPRIPSKPGTAGGITWTAPPPLPDAMTCVTSLGTWSVQWWGVMLCVSSPCAESIAQAIESLTLVGSFAEFGKTLVTAAISAASASSLVGLCVAIAVAFTGGVLKIWILTENDRSNGNGVCLRFFWPYLPLIGGTIAVGAR